MKIRNYSVPILALAAIFVLKALYLAFFVTPLWDVPDEVGHFSYVRDLANGRGIPVLGSAWVEADVARHFYQNADAQPFANWIAQHPPVYYLLAAVPLKIGMLLTDNPEVLYRLPRLVSALSGGLLLLVLFRTMRTLGLEPFRATALAATMGFIPMVSHLASGTTHDITLFLFSALGVHFLVRFLLQGKLGDAYWSAIWITLAGGTKMIAWVVIPPLIVIFLTELRGPIRFWLKHVCGITAVMLLLPTAWMSRNFLYYGKLTYTASTDATWRLGTPLSESFLDFLQSQPVIEFFILHFYGLLGWAGTGRGQLSWFQVAGYPRAAFSFTLLILALLITALLLRITWKVIRTPSGFLANRTPKLQLFNWLSSARIRISLLSGCLSIALIGAITVFTNSQSSGSVMVDVRLLSACLLLFAGVTSVPLLLYASQSLDKVALYALAVFLFFTAVLLWQVYEIYLLDGRLRATHGRYFYPAVPFILAALGVAVHRLRIPGTFLALWAGGLAIMELETFVVQLAPFYESARG